MVRGREGVGRGVWVVRGREAGSKRQEARRQNIGNRR